MDFDFSSLGLDFGSDSPQPSITGNSSISTNSNNSNVDMSMFFPNSAGNGTSLFDPSAFAPNASNNNGDSIAGQKENETNIAVNVFRLIVFSLGVIGNLLVIFVILILAEYKKGVTHLYVLQLAFADLLFLVSIPFRVTEDLNGGWKLAAWLCKAKETILFLNYYSSILFLMTMSVDRYIAICHGFSDRLQKLRTYRTAGIITAVIWITSLLICIPIMMNSGVYGKSPECHCSYVFPSHKTAEQKCIEEKFTPNTTSFQLCLDIQKKTAESTCDPFAKNDISSEGSGGGGLNPGNDAPPNFPPFNATTKEDPFPKGFPNNLISNPDPGLTGPSFLVDPTSSDDALKPGCHYLQQSRGFHTLLTFNFIVLFIVPLVIMTVCYALIIRRLRQMRMKSDSNVSEPSTHSTTTTGGKRTKSAAAAKDSRNRTRVTIMCACLVISFVVCWTPFHAVHLAKMTGGIRGTTTYCNTLSAAASLLAFINSALNPYLYNFIGTRFGSRLRAAARNVRGSVRKNTDKTAVVYNKNRRPTDSGDTGNSGTVMTKMQRKSDAGRVDSSSGALNDGSKQLEQSPLAGNGSAP